MKSDVAAETGVKENRGAVSTTGSGVGSGSGAGSGADSTGAEVAETEAGAASDDSDKYDALLPSSGSATSTGAACGSRDE